jgi:hypothetical protein
MRDKGKEKEGIRHRKRDRREQISEVGVNQR